MPLHLADASEDSHLCANFRADGSLILTSIDHQWVGLITCNGVSTDWFACGDNSPTITSGMGCSCPQTSATLAFTAAADPIPNIMQLGLSYGISSCYPGYSIYCAEATEGPSPSISSTAAPSSAATSASTPVRTSSEFLTTNSGGQLITVFITTTAPTSSPIISRASESSIGSHGSLARPTTSSAASIGGTNSPSPPIASGPGLQSRAEVGIGIGSAVGAVLVGALLWYCISCLRKRHKRESALSTSDKTGPGSSDETTGFAVNHQLGVDDPRSPTWSGHKSELPAENKDPRSPTWSGHKSELPTDDHEVKTPVPPYATSRGSYRSNQTPEAEGILGHGGHGMGLRDGLYEMP